MQSALCTAPPAVSFSRYGAGEPKLCGAFAKDGVMVNDTSFARTVPATDVEALAITDLIQLYSSRWGSTARRPARTAGRHCFQKKGSL